MSFLKEQKSFIQSNMTPVMSTEIQNLALKVKYKKYLLTNEVISRGGPIVTCDNAFPDNFYW